MRFVLVFVLATSLPLAAQSPPPPSAAARVDYENDVKPILAQHCYSCHGGTAQQAGLRLDQRQPALRGGDYGPVIVPGKSAESKLIRRLIDGDGGLQMPPSGALSPDQIGVLRAWIDQGPEFRTEIADIPAPPIDPRFAAAVMAVRSPAALALGNAARLDADLIIKGVDQSHNTLLHHAAGFGAIESLTRLLAAGAEVNARNRFRSTPLHWAVHDPAKVTLLLSAGAEVNAKQVEGRTPLFLAASMGGNHQGVKLLLDHGADPALATANGQTPLMAAAVSGNVELLRLLLGRGVDVNVRNGAGETALMFAASSGKAAAVALLLKRGADARMRSKRNETALGNAATTGVDDSVRLLLQHGAEVNVQNIRGFSPLMLAANSDSIPAGVVKLLLAAGAETSYTADYDETALDLASKRGDTPVTRLLAAATSRKPALAPTHAPAADAGVPVNSAVTRALTQLERQSFNFIRISGCNSCHSQDLPIAAAAFARSRGISAPAAIARLPLSMMPPPERLMDLSVVALMGPLWELFGMGMNAEPANAYTDAAVRMIRSAQRPQGYWSGAESRRPPMASGDFMASALAVFALTRYTERGDRATQLALDQATTWLARAKPEDTQDRAFHALALNWIVPRGERARTAAQSLIPLQRSDGGWSQLPAMPSDAYATGLALYTLHAAGQLSPADPVYRKGVDYLLRTQAADGTWHVKSRAIWLQPYFESGFPYGRDQFISAAGTAWAAMALTGAVETRTTTAR